MYAIVKSGGKQYKVAPGQKIEVERLNVTKGDTVDLDKVLLVADDDNVLVGTPVVEGAKIIATVGDEGKGKKVVVFKYKPKTRYRKKTGHRQYYTELSIDRIEMPGAVKEKPAEETAPEETEVTEEVTENGA